MENMGYNGSYLNINQNQKEMEERKRREEEAKRLELASRTSKNNTKMGKKKVGLEKYKQKIASAFLVMATVVTMANRTKIETKIISAADPINDNISYSNMDEVPSENALAKMIDNGYEKVTNAITPDHGLNHSMLHLKMIMPKYLDKLGIEYITTGMNVGLSNPKDKEDIEKLINLFNAMGYKDDTGRNLESSLVMKKVFGYDAYQTALEVSGFENENEMYDTYFKDVLADFLAKPTAYQNLYEGNILKTTKEVEEQERLGIDYTELMYQEKGIGR